MYAVIHQALTLPRVEEDQMSAPTTTHTEVEIKLDADEGFVLPELASLPGVATVAQGELQQLNAFYVDSSDLRLIRNKTTFRRRTGGQDAGWHLKLPAGNGTRIEVHRPVGDSIRDVPDELLALVRVQLRGEPVAPVAHIATHRTVHRLLNADGAVLAEVADDLVTAESIGDKVTATSWREIEVELVSGDTALLDAARAVLESAGARASSVASKLQRTLDRRLDVTPEPLQGNKKQGRKKQGENRRGAVQPNTAGAVAVAYLAAQVEALIGLDPYVRLDTEDAVHQMRVATRRLRSALATFRPFFTSGTSEPLRAELTWLGGVLGEARDAEVMRENLTRAVEALPAELVLGPVLRRIGLELGEAHQQAHVKVREALDSDRYLQVVTALEAFVTTPPLSARAAKPASDQLRLRVGTACRRLERSVAVLDGDLTSSERDLHLHDVRKAAKRARYAAEAARSLPGSDGKQAKAVEKAMEAIQKDLGDHQDAVVERTWLRDLGVRAFLNGENGFTFGLLHGLTVVRAEHDEQLFATLWQQAQHTIRRWPGEA
jgi:CHAD domain-containing protein